MANTLKRALQKTGSFFKSLDQSVYRVTVAVFCCLLVYLLITPWYPMKHVDYMLNAVFVIASLTKAATNKAAVERAIATLFGILIGALVFLKFGSAPNYWVIIALTVFFVAVVDYLYFGYYLNVAVMVCWALLGGGATEFTHGVEAYIVERVVTNAIGIGVCLLVYLVWPSKVREHAFQSQAGAVIERIKADALAQISGKAPSPVAQELLAAGALVSASTLVEDEASMTLKGTRDTRMPRVAKEVKSAIYNLNMLKDFSGTPDKQSLGLLEAVFGVGAVTPAPLPGAQEEADDRAYNYHLQAVCRHLLNAQRINRKIQQ